MNPPDLSKYQGKPVREVFQQASSIVDDAKKQYAEALQLYRLCAAQKTGRYMLGRLRERIWELEQCFGQHRVYFSAAGQDHYLHQVLFRDKQQGSYVEIGGYNGWDLSFLQTREHGVFYAGSSESRLTPE